MAETTPGGERPDADLIRSLEAADIHPLWDRYKGIIPINPDARDDPKHWRWRDVEPLADRAAVEVPVEDVERRALIMVNPAFDGGTVATGNLIAAFTVLEPGDRAVPHRHSAPAIRFGFRSEGAATIVNGRRCDMGEGDLVLTPPMCWHGHINDSDHRTVWFDALGSPLINMLDASFFEAGSREDNEFWQVDEGEERWWEGAGLIDPNAEHIPEHTPKYRYPGATTRRVLDGMAAGPDGSRILRYVNPITGGAVMSAMDCYMARVPKGTTTRPKRATHNTVCFVLSGEGRSTVDNQTFDWTSGDIFSVPHWDWASHEARGGDADIFMVTDRVVYESLGLLREEMQ